jgi:hypothetical protein
MHDRVNHFQNQLRTVRTVMSAYEQLLELAKQHPEVRGFIAWATKDDGPASVEFTQLLTLLKSPQFEKTDDAGYFMTWPTTLVAYRLLLRNSHELTRLITLLGKFDYYTSLARMIRDYPGHFSYVQFVEGAQPVMQATQFWSPLVPLAQAVPNDLSFSKDMRGIVVTGANGSGKSTIAAKGLLVMMILALSTGITSAQQLITNIMHLISLMHIQSLEQYGLSHYMSELAHVAAALKKIDALGDKHHVLCIMDEVCEGTNHLFGTQALIKIIQKLDARPQVLYSVVTQLHDVAKKTAARHPDSLSAKPHVVTNRIIAPGIAAMPPEDEVYKRYLPDELAEKASA